MRLTGRTLIQRYWFLMTLFLCSVIFFWVYVYVYWGEQGLPLIGNSPENNPPHLILNQPDEAANYFFIRSLALDKNFTVFEPVASLTGNQVHPRSTTIVHGHLTPISFPGMIALYGFISHFFVVIFGTALFNLCAIALTPLLAVIAPWFLYGWLRRVMSEGSAKISSLLLFILPPWWYYASRPFQHHIVFITFFLVALYCLERARASFSDRRLQSLWLFLFGLSTALTLYIRTSEVVWVTGVLAVVFWQGRRSWQRRGIAAMVGAVCLVLGVFFLTQIAYYGSPLGTGYARPESNGSAGTFLSNPQHISLWQAVVAPFGIHPIHMGKAVMAYIVQLFWWSWFLEVIGAGMCFFTYLRLKKSGHPVATKQVWAYLFAFGVASFYLLIFYGSWDFSDNLAGVSSIGSSYARYFLPISVFALPFGAYVIQECIKKEWKGKLVASMIVLIFFLFSFRSVYLAFEGLTHMKQTLFAYGEWQKKLYILTPSSAIIVTRYGDKYLFPGRHIIPGMGRPEQKEAVQTLLTKKYPVYLYDIDVSGLRPSDLATYHIRIGPSLASWEGVELRRLTLE